MSDLESVIKKQLPRMVLCLPGSKGAEFTQ